MLALAALVAVGAVLLVLSRPDDHRVYAPPRDQVKATRSLRAFLDFCRHPKRRTTADRRELERALRVYVRTAEAHPDRWLSSGFLYSADITLREGLRRWGREFASDRCPGGTPYSARLRRAQAAL